MRISGPVDNKQELHVASLLVHCPPAALAGTTTAIAALQGAEVHGADPVGKLVVTAEAENEGEILRLIDRIQDMEGVLSAILVYHEFDRSDATGAPQKTERQALS